MVNSGHECSLFRNFDPALGRMTQVDPLADRYSSFSTYNFAFNDPVFWNDPLGDSPVDDANRSRNADIQRNQANTYRPIGDDMYGSYYSRYGPGDGRALYRDINESLVGSHAAAARRDATYLREIANLVSLLGDGVTPILDFVTIEEARSNSNFLQDRIDSNYINTQQQTNGNGPSDDNTSSFSIDKWFNDHYYGEFSSELSVGAQATIVFTKAGPVPAPYLRGNAAFGLRLNLGSVVLAGKTIKMGKDGVQSTKGFKSANQGIGVTLLGTSFDYERKLSFGKAENSVTGSIYGFGFKYNITNEELIIGIVPSASFAFIVGGKLELISGVRFK